MFLIDYFRNYVNALVGRNQEFEELLAAGDIDAAKQKMVHRQPLIEDAMRDYDVSKHEVMKREDKIITNTKGERTGTEPVHKLPIPYQVYINEISLVFLYGRPVKWTQQSDNTDDAFAMFLDVIKRTHFNSKIRQCKRIAGAETESAMLFRCFKHDDDGKPDVQIRVLAASKGDEIYTRWDNFENLISVAWGYYVRETEDDIVYHLDIYTAQMIYHCSKKRIGWEVVPEQNFIGKIPVILFWQDKEWKGVERLIEREEMIASRTADTNDYFADPIAIMSADVIKSIPKKNDNGKLIITNDSEGVDKAARYLTWDSAPESKKQEIEWLQEQILSKSFTPKISLDSLQSISQLSAKALRTVMMLADIKASKHKEVHDELLDRTASLLTSIIGNVLDTSLHAQCEQLVIGHEFQEPFGEDIADDLNNISKAVDAGILSTEGAIELNPLPIDKQREKERLAEEAEERQRTQASIFGDIAGAGAQSYGDGSSRDDEDDDADEDDENNDNNKSQNKKSNKTKK